MRQPSVEIIAESRHRFVVRGHGRMLFHVTPGQVITIAAATGGHAAAVERFAVTGARVG
jgi:hypothetical protein